jgi:protein-S-isoprenylcysteine O-methyltransferase Ste14
MSQHQISIAVAVVVVVAAIAVVAFLITKKRRSQALRERFGPEYDRVVRQEGNTSRGEEVL